MKHGEEEMSSVEGSSHEGEGSSAEDRLNAKLKAMDSAPAAQVSEVDVEAGVAATAPSGSVDATEVTARSVENGRGDVSASTIARMMGLATANEISMLEGKIDLLSSRVNNVSAKLERLQGVLNGIPTNSDLDRIDINIGSLKTLIKESLDQLSSADKELAKGDEGTLKKAKVMTSDE